MNESENRVKNFDKNITVCFISPESNEEGKKYPFHFPFHTLDNIIFSPHRGYSPFNDLLRWNEVIENITWLAQRRTDFINVVNLDEEY